MTAGPVYVLSADSRPALADRTALFRRHMQPLLAAQEAHWRRDPRAAGVPELAQYAQVCRWPFRQLEYSFALEFLLDGLSPDNPYLDAGAGVTPLAYVLARRQVRATVCDVDGRLMDALRGLNLPAALGAPLTYVTQDLTDLSFPDASFQAISCISVLEHIAAPADQRALRELLRVLRPGGVLVLTVDFAPPAAVPPALRRGLNLVRHGRWAEAARGLVRNWRARRAVQGGVARHARSANQCFEAAHLKDDVLPVLAGERLASRLPFASALDGGREQDARRFWDLEPGLFDAQGRRNVLPAALAIRKGAAAAG